MRKLLLSVMLVVVAMTLLWLMPGTALAAGPVIVLDPGHSGTSLTTIDPATQIEDEEYSNMPEMKDVFDVAVILKAKLEAAGYTVLMTKQSYTDTVTKRQRADLANNNHAALAISIHTSGHTFGTYGQIYVQRLDSYRTNIYGQNVYFTDAAVAATSQAYGQKFLAARRAIEGSSVVVTVNTSFEGRGLAPGNLPIVQLFSKVPWIYNEAGAPQNASDKERYAQSLFNGIVACVPIGGTVTPPPSSTYARYDQTDGRVKKTGTWGTLAKTDAYDGSYGRSLTAGASATINFVGTRLDCIAMTGTTLGVTDVYLDGVKKATLNLYASLATYQVAIWSTGNIPMGSHTVKLVRSSSSANTRYITLDAVDIWGTIK